MSSGNSQIRTAPPIDDREALADFVARQLEIPAALAPELRSELAGAIEFSLLRPGEHLIERGATVAGISVIHSGLLETSTGELGKARSVGWLTRGDILGDRNLLTGYPAEATVTAKRLSLVLQIEAGFCRDRLLENPEIRSTLAVRCLAEIGVVSERPSPFVASIVLLGEVQKSDAVVGALHSACEQRKSTELIAASPISPLTDGEDCLQQLAPLLHELGQGQQMQVILARESEHRWCRTAIAQADHVVTMVTAAPDTSTLEIVQAIAQASAKCEVVYLTLEADSDSYDAWQEGLQDRGILENSGTDPAELLLGLDIMYQEHADDSWLRQFELFRELNAHSLQRVHQHVTWRDVPGGKDLIAPGVADDNLYLVQGGRFQVFHGAPEGDELVAEILPGEAINASSSLVGGPRRATVRAARDSQVACIEGHVFRAMLVNSAPIASGLASAYAHDGVREQSVSTRRPPRNIAVVPLTTDSASLAAGDSLARCLEAMGIRIGVLDADVVNTEVSAGAAELEHESARSAALHRFLHAFEDTHELVLYRGTGESCNWTARCLRQADLVLLVADATADPGLREVETTLFGESAALERETHLLLLQPAHSVEATGTRNWLDQRPDVLHHHARVGSSDDFSRVARRITRRANGVAFSGASSRGIAHLGVVRAMRELGIPLDVTSGSSSGAAIASLVAIGLEHEEMMSRSLRFLAGVGVRLSRLQPPLTSLMSGRTFERHLREAFGDRRLEDQFVGCTLTGVDLNHHRLVRMRSGPIWLAARASMSLPMFWPPVWFDDHLLVDGGIMSYMPIEEVLGECQQGLAIASDLDLNAGKDVASFEGYEHYGATLSSWDILRQRFRPGADKARYPNLSDVLFHAMCIPSFQHQQRLRDLGSHDTVRFVRPPVTADGFFTVDGETSQRFEQLAFESAMKVLGTSSE